MKRLLFLVVLLFIVSCAPTSRTGSGEDSLVLTRKYVGNFVDYRQHIPKNWASHI
jgi:hypothetical protein